MVRRSVTDPPPSTDADERRREWSHDSETDAASLLEPNTAAESGAPDARTFLVVRGHERAEFIDLEDPGEWILGRSSDAHVVIQDSQASRQHAKVTLASGVLSVEDLGSRNGTIVNGRVLRAGVVRIGTGDVLEVGAWQIVVATRAQRVAASRRPLGEDGEPADIVVADAEMARLYSIVRKVAAMPTTVLVLGETGSGKDVLAQRLHLWSPRARKPFVRVNCAGIPESLLESELFGHERGAFTGAERRKAGYFEAANEGTIFLDEIGELSESAQVRLLNVLETRTVTRLGGTTPVGIDVRVVCATHRDLQALLAEGRFRSDLYYRICPFIVRMPPLRQRPAEIAPIADVFVRLLAHQVGLPPPTIVPDAIAMLTAYDWPGNVRELRNAVEHAFVMAEGATLREEHFAPEIRARAADPRATPAPIPVRQRTLDAERQAIEEALLAEGGNQTRAAVRLGMPRRTLVYKLRQYRQRREGSGGEE